MPHLKITIETDRAHSDQLADFFQKFAAVSVSFEAASDEPVFDHSDGNEPGHWQRTRVTGLFPVDIDVDILLVCLRDQFGTGCLFDRRIQFIEDTDWVADYQSQHQALLFADRVCVCPGWCEPPAGDYALIQLDPGLAFGTGTHATTALCIEALVHMDLTRKSVIDYGCGSGILALVAARLGAQPVTAVDIDSQALQATAENATRNQLTEHLTIAHADMFEPAASDVLVANVLLNPLLDLAERFAACVKPGGQLFLSGLLPDQVERCLAVYADCFTMAAPVFKDEWALLSGIRQQDNRT